MFPPAVIGKAIRGQGTRSRAERSHAGEVRLQDARRRLDCAAIAAAIPLSVRLFGDARSVAPP
jgi:hypothetical protein